MIKKYNLTVNQNFLYSSEYSGNKEVLNDDDFIGKVNKAAEDACTLFQDFC